MNTPKDEWRYEILISELPAGGKTYKLKADAAFYPQIAERIMADGVEALEGTLKVTPIKDGAALEGTLTARLLRSCVASLEPMHEDVSDQFSLQFRANIQAPNEEEELDLEALAVEPLESDALDLADLLVQQLALAMAPYPRKQDGDALLEAHGQEALSSPFAALSALTEKNPKNVN